MAVGQARPWPGISEGEPQCLIACPYFTLELLAGASQPFALDTRRQSFHTLTVVDGRAQVAGAGWSHPLGRFQTLVVPAACGAYTVQPLDGEMQVLKASVERQPG